MNKIYIVTCSNDDYKINEKAFVSYNKAKKYVEELNRKPDFITDDFEADYFECDCEVTEEWPDSPYPKNDKRNNEWYKEQEQKEMERLCLMMQKKGYNLTVEMCRQYEDWQYEDKKFYDIEELELCE